MKLWHAIAVIALAAGGYGLYRVIAKPVPGQNIQDMGQEHVSPAQVLETKYNSNPPTSGPHLPTWVKPGIYDTPQSEGELIHSLEHGYVIISYNCNVHLNASLPVIPAQAGIQKDGSPIGVGDDKIISKVFAHEEDPQATPSATFDLPGQSTDPSGKTGPYIEGKGFYPDGKFPNEATGTAKIDYPVCTALVKQLSDLAQKKKLFKLIVVPRSQLDTTIALTAWTYIDKFDPDPIGVDTKRIEKFIDYHRDHGPEKTME